MGYSESSAKRKNFSTKYIRSKEEKYQNNHVSLHPKIQRRKIKQIQSNQQEENKKEQKSVKLHTEKQ